MSYIIYQHKNRLNGKSYIGYVVSHKGVRSRWLRHVCDARNGSSAIFHRAIIAYGDSDDVWEHNIIEEVNSAEEAFESEKRWIAELKTNGLKEDHHGYNMTDGGEGMVGFKHDEETKQKMSVARKGKKKSERTKLLMRKPKSPEHAQKLRDLLVIARAKFAEERQCV